MTTLKPFLIALVIPQLLIAAYGGPTSIAPRRYLQVQSTDSTDIYAEFGVTQLLEAKPFHLPKLPWNVEDFEGRFSKLTLSFHYGKHHASYVRQLNALAAEDSEGRIAKKSLIELIQSETGLVYNSAAQIWNHDFYWNSISPEGGGLPFGPIADKINQSFGNFGNFKEQFTGLAKSHFGSGYVWLVEDKGKLLIQEGDNADNPIRNGNAKPLLTIDVWEHAYYLPFKNNRLDFIEEWFGIVNWEFANARLKSEDRDI